MGAILYIKGKLSMTVTFFGNADAPDRIQAILETIVRELIWDKGAKQFYLGDRGNFDRISAEVLRKVKSENPEIKIETVIAYIPRKKQSEIGFDTIYPEGLENVPRKYTICKRNEWMLSQADCVVTYVRNPFGNAAKYKALAEKKGKRVIELCEYEGKWG